MTNETLAYCGFDCAKCDVYVATVNNDDALRKKTASLWSDLNKTEILPQDINCLGCQSTGVKTRFCESMCQIRQCAIMESVNTCADCAKMETCATRAVITKNNPDALENLRHHKTK